jgi:hypothetical protein
VGRGRLMAPTGSGAPASELDRLLERRSKILATIAERYRELLDPLGGPAGVRGDGGSVSLMAHEPRCLIRVASPARCSCAYRSVAEFGRLVARLRLEERSLWWHLDGWWLSAETRTINLCPRCGPTHASEHRHPSRKRSGKSVTVKCKRVVVWSRRSGARESSARAALLVMAGWWALESEPELPEDVRKVAR